MLRSKIVYLEQIYKFCFDHFLEKRTVFILIMKNVIFHQKSIKIKDSFFRTNSATYEKSVKKQNSSFQKDLQFCF